MTRRATLAFVAAIALLASLASAASAVSRAPDLWLYGRRTTIGEGIISATARHERLAVEVAPSKDHWVAVVVRNRGTEDASFDVTATLPTLPFSATFEVDGRDVTDAIASGSYEPTIRAGKRLIVYAEISVAADAQTGQSSQIRITGQPAGGRAADQVRILLSVPPIRVWGVNYTGTVRCQATFPLRQLQPGYRTRVSFRVTNISDDDVSVYGSGSLRFLDASGNELWSSEPPWEGPVWATTLHPGQTSRVFSFDARVRWSGPLTLVPVCGGLRINMPHVVLPVAEPGAPATVADAIRAAVDLPASPFQSCPPGPTGEANTGSFDTPDGRDLPPLTLRCWAEVTQEQGFDVVSLQLVSPSDAPDYSIQPENGFFGPELPGADNMLAARWDFVVTADEVRPFLSRMQSRDLGEGTGYEYELHDGEWSVGGWGPCGYESWGASTNGETFMLDWITGCVQTATPTPTPTTAVPGNGSTSGGSQLLHLGPRAVVVRRY